MRLFISRSGWSFADRLAAFVTFLGCALLLLHPQLGRLEGAALPVAQISDIVVAPDGDNTAITGEVVVLRPSCSFSKIEWFLVGEGREAQIPIIFSEGTVVRPGGASTFGPWILTIPEDAFEQTRADVYHRCPWRPWPIVTHLYP